jgi:hypothetical protein
VVVVVRRQGQTKQPMEVHIQFEPSRIERACLANAYERIVPIIRRTVMCTGNQDGEIQRHEMVRRTGGAKT